MVDLYDPKPVYRRSLTLNTAELPQFSTKPSVDVESELRKIESLKKFPTAYDAAVAEIEAHADSEAKAESLDHLKELSKFLDYYGPIVNQAREAQKELVMKFLLDGEDLEDLKAALGTSTSWLTVQSWAGEFSGIGSDKEFVGWKVPRATGERIDARVAEVARKAAEAKERAAANKAAEEKRRAAAEGKDNT